MKAVVAGLMLVAAAASAAPALGQEVGYPPDRSPYQDLRSRQQITLFSGYYYGSTGRVGVAPGDGPLLGLQYDIQVGGPAAFTVRLARTFTERTVIDPSKPVATRHLGTKSAPLYLTDVGVTLNVTGQKSYRGFVPTVHGGIGVASDAGAKADVGGYSVGTPFAIVLDAGLRHTLGRRYEARLGIGDYLYQIKYPGSYLTPPAGVTPVLPEGAGKSEWKNNRVLTIGIAYLFGR